MNEPREAPQRPARSDAAITGSTLLGRALFATPTRGGEQAMPRIAWLVMLLALALAVPELPGRIDLARSTLDRLRRWPDRAAQMRDVVGARLYDDLVAADRVLPPDAKVMLVTTGQDVRHAEYTAFHRALYLLAPRPVWWVVPVERDGTWESRWWTPASLDPAALLRQARSFGASHLLALGTDASVLPGNASATLPGGARLYSLVSGAEPDLPARDSKSLREIDRLWPLRLAAAIALILLAGDLITGLVLGGSRRPRRLERLALSWLLGAGAVSLAMYWLGVLGLALPVQLGSLSLLIVLGALVRYARRRGMGAARPVFRARPATALGELFAGASRTEILISTLLAALIAAEVVNAALTAVGQPLRVWDSWVSWGMRARMIYLRDGLDALAYADPSRTVTLQSYPLLVPSVEAWTYGWLGAPDDRFAGVQAVLFLAAMLGLVHTALRPPVSRSFALLAMLVLVSISFIGGLAGIVFADIPLAAYVVAAGLYLRRWLAGGSARELALGALLAGLLPWTKAEGWLLMAALLASSLVCAALGSFERRRAALACLATACAAGVLAGPWYVRAAELSAREATFMPFTPATFAAHAGRLAQIIVLGVGRAWRAEWHGLWLLMLVVPLGLVLARRPLRPFFLATTVFYGCAIALIYVFSAYAPLEAHIVRSVDRLMAQVAPLAVLWLAEAARGDPGAGLSDRPSRLSVYEAVGR